MSFSMNLWERSFDPNKEGPSVAIWRTGSWTKCGFPWNLWRGYWILCQPRCIERIQRLISIKKYLHWSRPLRKYPRTRLDISIILSAVSIMTGKYVFFISMIWCIRYSLTAILGAARCRMRIFGVVLVTLHYLYMADGSHWLVRCKYWWPKSLCDGKLVFAIGSTETNYLNDIG